MANPKRVRLEIPFSGFYESKWSEGVDYHEQQEAENYADRDREEQPVHLRLDAGAYAALLYECANYGKIYQAVARSYADAFEHVVSRELGWPLGLVFEEVRSPREYNFETDRIFCTAPFATVRACYALSKANRHVVLARHITEKFTTRSGFISFYSNDVNQWIAKPLIEWDANELGTLLGAVLELMNYKWERDVEEIVLWGGNGELDDDYAKGFDYDRFERAVAERRAKLSDGE